MLLTFAEFCSKVIEHSKTVIIWEEQIFDQINNCSRTHFNRQQSKYDSINTTFSLHEAAVAQAIIWTHTSTGAGAVALI
jgi:hypothetical protein